jgi:hypothetical protein
MHKIKTFDMQEIPNKLLSVYELWGFKQPMELVKGVQEKSSQLKVIFHETIKAHYTYF